MRVAADELRVAMKTIYFLSTLSIATSWRWCYVCTGVGEDRTCETSPNHVRHGPRAINCTSRFCTAVKVTYKGSGESQSFARLCEDLDRGNWCLHDPLYITCYTTCSQDFCNDGNPSHVTLPEVDANAAKKLFEEHKKIHQVYLSRNTIDNHRETYQNSWNVATHDSTGSGGITYSTTSVSGESVYGQTDSASGAPFGLSLRDADRSGLSILQSGPKHEISLAATPVPLRIKASHVLSSGSCDTSSHVPLLTGLVACVLQTIITLC